MPVQPVFPQFSLACDAFARPGGYPRPFGALDWCPRCGQPDWAHRAGADARVAGLRDLDQEQMADMLEYLCTYSPATYDIINDVVAAARGIADLAGEAGQEPFCAECGAPVAVFLPDGPNYRHYRETPDGSCDRWDPAHQTVISWRPRTDV
jgi:hypothetical protein